MEKIAKIEALHYSKDIIAERHTFLNASPANLKTHAHHVYQMGVTMRDPGGYYVGDKFYKVPKDTFFCFHPEVSHASIGKINKGVFTQGTTLYISTELLQFLNFQLFRRDEPPYFKEVFYGDKEVVTQFRYLFDAVWTEKHDLASYRLHLLLRLLTGKGSAEAEPGNRHQIIAALQSYVFSRIDQPVSLSAFARLYGMSLSTLSRLFQRSAGMSPYTYVNQLRIQAAKELLKNRRTIKEVASMTGHYDESHLRKNFKQYIGVSPAGYKVRR